MKISFTTPPQPINGTTENSLAHSSIQEGFMNGVKLVANFAKQAFPMRTAFCTNTEREPEPEKPEINPPPEPEPDWGNM